MSSIVRSIVAVAVVVALAVALPAAAQSTTTGSVRGVVTDPEGGVLPGVTVIAQSDALIGGRQVAISNERGVYRFPSLPPGLYAFEAQLQGFQPVRQENIRVQLGQAVDLGLELGDVTISGEIVVVAEATQVSMVSNTVSFNLSQDFIERQPLSRDPTGLMNYAPGITDDQAYGAPSTYQNAYNLDGVDVSDPALGSQWVLPSMDWVQEVQVTGLGADAEFGGFTGAVVNLITKSGGNDFRGDLRLYFSDDSLNSDKAEAIKSDWDASASLGGPIVRDKAWFFVSVNQRERTRDVFFIGDVPAAETGDTAREWTRVLAKITSQLNDSNRLVALVDYDAVTEDARGIGDFTLSSAGIEQDSPSYSYNLTWESLVNDSNFVTAKLTGFSGEDDRSPLNGANRPGREDFDSGYLWDNYKWTDDMEKARMTLDASWSLFADGLFTADDSHNFKLGVTYERSTDDEVSRRNGGFSYYDDSYWCDSLDDYFADPFCGVFSSDWGGEMDLHGKMEGLHLYAQDSWKTRRVTVNFGLRYSAYSGAFKGGSDVYDVDMVAPRLGLVWDVLGDGSTALKAHYGRYHEGMSIVFYDREGTGDAFSDIEYFDFNFSTGAFDIPAGGRVQAGAVVDPGIGHPYVDQYVLTFERQLTDTMLLGLDYVYRENGDIAAMVTSNVADYDVLVAPDNPLGGTMPFFDLLEAPVYVITNPVEATREYDSVALRLRKRYADGWSLDASLVWSDLEGNASWSLAGYVTDFQDANGFVNADGKLPFNSEWVLKLSASVDLPWEIMAAGFYQYRTGEYWTPYVRMRGLLENDRTGVYMTPRGSRQLDDRSFLDLRLEKSFGLGGGLELTLMVDAFNVLDDDRATAVDTRWGEYRYQWDNHPDGSQWRASSTFGEDLSFQSPREIRLGAKLSF